MEIQCLNFHKLSQFKIMFWVIDSLSSGVLVFLCLHNCIFSSFSMQYFHTHAHLSNHYLSKTQEMRFKHYINVFLFLISKKLLYSFFSSGFSRQFNAFIQGIRMPKQEKLRALYYGGILYSARQVQISSNSLEYVMPYTGMSVINILGTAESHFNGHPFTSNYDFFLNSHPK